MAHRQDERALPAIWFLLRDSASPREEHGVEPQDPAGALPPWVWDLLRPWRPYTIARCFPRLAARLRVLMYCRLKHLGLYWHVEFQKETVDPYKVVDELIARKGEIADAGVFASDIPFKSSALHSAVTGCDQDWLRIHRAQFGVGSELARHYDGGRGGWQDGLRREAVRVIDIEYGYYKNVKYREPICISVAPDTLGQTGVDGCYMTNTNRFHGTLTLGVLFADDETNPPKILGICPEAEPYFVHAVKGDVCRAVDAASVQLRYRMGDVLLIEREMAGSFDPDEPEPTENDPKCPVEIDRPIRDAIRGLIECLGVTVVLPAGNGKSDLADFYSNGKRIWSNIAGESDDTGSVIVGAGHSADKPNKFERFGDSNWGDRVNCQGWGECVRTTRKEFSHEDNYSDTSAAAAMIAGVVASLQGAHRARYGQALPPDKVRAILEDSNLSVHGSDNTLIGPLPDLSRILPYLIPSQISPPFIRPDFMERFFEIPWQMLCPDIVIGPDPLPPGPVEARYRHEPHRSRALDPAGKNSIQLVFRGSGNERVEFEATAYAFAASCFPHPRLGWNRVATWEIEATDSVPHVTEPRPLSRKELPNGMHCGFAVLPTGAAGPLAGHEQLAGLGTDDFRRMLRDGAIGVRSAAIYRPAPGQNSMELQLQVSGLAESRERHTLAFDYRLPEDSAPSLEWDGDVPRGVARFPRVDAPMEVELDPDARHQLKLHVPISASNDDATYEIRVRQFAGAIYLGRFTFLIRMPTSYPPPRI